MADLVIAASSNAMRELTVKDHLMQSLPPAMIPITYEIEAPTCIMPYTTQVVWWEVSSLVAAGVHLGHRSPHGSTSLETIQLNGPLSAG